MLCFLGSLLLRLALQPILESGIPFITFFPGVIVSAWFGGFGPGVVTTILSAAGALYIVHHALVVTGAAEVVGLLLFLTISVCISWLHQLLWRAQSSTETHLAYLRLVIDGVPGLVSYIDRNYKYQFSNRGYREWFQQPGLDLNGMSVTELVGEKGLAEIRPHLDRAFRGEQVTFERRLKYPDGERDARVTYVPDRGTDDHLRGVVVLVQDITEEKRAAEKLRAHDQHVRALVKHSSDGVILLDRKAAVLFSGAPILGYENDEWHGRNGMDLLHPDDRPLMMQEFSQISQEPGKTVTVRYRARHKNGSWRWVEAICRNLLHEPAVGGIVMNYRDITEQQQVEEHLREQAQLLELTQDAIFVLSWDGTIEFWNRGAEERYGWSRAEAIGQIVHDLLRTEFPEPLGEIQTKLVRDGYWQGELGHTTRDGKTIAVASRWALRRSADNRPSGLLEITTDITERKRAEEQLRQAAKLESLGVLAGGIAHDFNNLLVGMMGNASLALEDTEPVSPNHQLLQNVISASQRAADLTKQMLAYAGKGRFVLRRVDISDLVRELSALIEAAIPKHVQLRLDLQANIPAVEADVSQLQQVVMNLVINGAEAMGPEPGAVLVSTSIQDVDSQYVANLSLTHALTPGTYAALEVHDNGCGMDQGTLSKIFDPFFTTKFQGRGLGLAAVQGIVRGHRGGLKVYSAPGKGTTFKVLLPTVAGPAAPLGTPEIEGQARLHGTGVVLVIDDEQIVRQMAKNGLERYGYSVMLASNGREGVAVFKNHQSEIRLVLLDLTMPIMSGEEALRELKGIDPDVRVVLSSGFNEVEATRRFAGMPFGGFIQKPYTAAALASKVKEILEPDS